MCAVSVGLEFKNMTKKTVKGWGLYSPDKERLLVRLKYPEGQIAIFESNKIQGLASIHGAQIVECEITYNIKEENES